MPIIEYTYDIYDAHFNYRGQLTTSSNDRAIDKARNEFGINYPIVQKLLTPEQQQKEYQYQKNQEYRGRYD